MPFTALVIGHRLPGVSSAQFKQHYENHISQIQEMTGEHFPLSHTRRYVQRDDSEKATVLAGSQTDFEYDVLVEMAFENEGAFKAFCEVLFRQENADWIKQDESHFWDRSRGGVVVLGETVVTERKA